MVTSITRQSVLIKCNMQASIMLGNYEFYYAAGLFLKLKGTAILDEGIKPRELYELLEVKWSGFESQDFRENYLVKLLMNYKPSDEYDEQMQKLLHFGLHEEQMWQVQIDS